MRHPHSAPHRPARMATLGAAVLAALVPAGCASPNAAPDIDPDAASGVDPCPRLFSAASPWNTPATMSGVDPASPTMILSGAEGGLAWSFAAAGHGLDIAGSDDYPEYGIPLYMASGTDPLVHVKDKYGWWGGGFDGVPMPVGASPSTGAAHWLSIWDVAHDTLYEFSDMQPNDDGTWSAGSAALFSTVREGFQSAEWAISARAYGGSAIAGAIRHCELDNGVIPHALSIGYPGTLGQKYAAGIGVDRITQNIASHSNDDATAERNTPFNIPEGARLRLKGPKTINVADRCSGQPLSCIVIGTALQTYGAYVVDTTTTPTLFVEASITGQSWHDKLHVMDARVWAAEDFELLSLPDPLTAPP